ncbi:MAG: phosphotransferase enzyme family protein [Candidatus Sericytochromatia bacterium]
MLSPFDYRQIEPTSLSDLAERWEAGSRVLRLLGDVENLVWHAEGSQPYVIRLTSPAHRSLAALEAELAWLGSLNQASLPVCRPLPDLAGQLLTPYRLLDQDFFACAFAWVPGEALEQSDPWSNESVQALGKLAARLHLHGHSLSPELLKARPDWKSGPHFSHPEAFLKADQLWVLDALALCRAQLELLPMTPDHYGLIHGDIHRGNFFLEGQRPQLFDFDDCHLGWYAQDLAQMLYSAIPRKGSNSAGFAGWFIDQLKLGYHKIRAWPSLAAETMELFLHWRDLQLFLFIHCRWPELRPERAQDSLDRIEPRLRKGLTLID